MESKAGAFGGESAHEPDRAAIVLDQAEEFAEVSRSKALYLRVFAFGTILVIMLAAIRWSRDHPYGAHWDEASYINEVLIDTQRLQSGMLLKLGGRILLKSWGHPPAYRILAVPFLALFGVQTTTIRLVSLACFGVSAWLIYLTTRRIGSQAAAALAVLVFCLSPQIVGASIWFGTEGPLFLSTSAMLYYVFLCWTDRSERSESSGAWVGLGLAVGLGLLSKASFVLIALPVLAFWLVLDHWGHLSIPRLTSQRKAGALALLVAAPWWVVNLRSSMSYAEYARGFVRNSLGPPSVVTWTRWLSSAMQGLLGHGLSIFIGLVIIAYLGRAFLQQGAILNPLQKAAIGACACAGAPIILAQLSGTNHLLRHISPAMIPLAVMISVLADVTGWARSWPSITVLSALFCAQLLMIVAPVLSPNKHLVDSGLVNGSLPWRIMVRSDQWNWSPLQDISHGCGVDNPEIAFLGSGRAFNPPQIEYPWAVKAVTSHRAAVDYPDVKWLWRYEEGPVNWEKLMYVAGQSDIVLTAPGYVGQVANREDLDNQHNSELADRLSRDPRFRGPIRMRMGRFEPVEIFVFVKRSLICQSEDQPPTTQ